MSSMTGCGGKKAAEMTNGETDSVESVSHLQVDGLMLKNAAGDTVVLNGPSLGWHSNWGRFYNDSTVMAFKQRWGANITRAAIGAHTSGDVVNCYDSDSADAMTKLYAVIDAAIENGMKTALPMPSSSSLPSPINMATPPIYSMKSGMSLPKWNGRKSRTTPMS